MKNFIIAAAAVTAFTFAATSSADAGHRRYRSHRGYSQISFGGNGWNISIGNYGRRSHYGNYGNYGYRNSYYQPAHTWHDTSHWDYQPATLRRHGNHYDYQPASWIYHRTGHVHHNHR